MKLAPFVTLLSALGAAALMFSCFFAGYSTTTLTNVNLFSVNVSRTANTQLQNQTADQPTCGCVTWSEGGLFFNGTQTKNKTVATTVELDISELYSVFVLTTCDGGYLPNYQAPNAQAVLTNCQSPSLSYNFNLVQIMEDAIARVAHDMYMDLSLDSLHWPDGITDAFVYVKSANKALGVFFIFAHGFLIVTILSATLALFRPSHNAQRLLFVVSTLALVSLGIAAGISTAITTTVVNAINADGDTIGISANQGSLFLGMMFSAVALLLISTLITTAQLCVGGGQERRSRRSRRQPSHGYHMPYQFMHPTSSYGYMPQMPHMSQMSHMSHMYQPSGYDFMDPHSSRRHLLRSQPPMMQPNDLWGGDDEIPSRRRSW